MSTQVEQIVNRRACTRDLNRRIPRSRCLGDQFPVSHAVASQLVRHDLTWLSPVTFERTSEETLGSLPISTRLQEPIHDFAILIHCTLQILLLALDFHEHVVDEKRIAVASMCAP